MIEIIIFYLLFRTTLIIGFLLGYSVRGLLQLIAETKLKEKEAGLELESLQQHVYKYDSEKFLNDVINYANNNNDIRKVYLN